jgi:SAM-dependent methyltransferase
VSSGAVTNTDPILAEQLAYYRARAREYDKWFRREGLHDLGEEHNARWRLELNRVFSALDAFAPRGDVLELAYGTGEWTIRLAESATRVVGVDAAPEMRELALAKLQDAGKSNVELRVDDLFSWQPDQDYDVVFFAFWLSHVPESRAHRFWRSVHDALRPGGRFFLVDAARAVPERNVMHVRNCPIATARPSSGDSRTVGRFELSSARSIPTGSREIFVNTGLTPALSRQASSLSTDSADVPSPT